MRATTDHRRTASASIKGAVLDATERLLATHGYRKMAMDDIAAEADIGRRTIYLHFSGKEEVALSSIDRVVERVIEQLRFIAASGLEPAERIERMLVMRVLARFDSVRDYKQSLAEMLAGLRPAYLARRDLYFEAEADVFAGVIGEAQRLGAVRAGDPLGLAHALITGTNSLLPFALSPAELGDRIDVEQKASAVAELLVAGLLKGRKEE